MGFLRSVSQVLQEVADLLKRVPLMESIAKEMKELQELARYPFILNVESSLLFIKIEICTGKALFAPVS